MNDILKANNDDPSDESLIPLTCKQNYPMTDWKKTWTLVRSRGLGPELTSMTLKILWGIVPTRARLHRILPMAHTSPNCTERKTRTGQSAPSPTDKISWSALGKLLVLPSRPSMSIICYPVKYTVPNLSPSNTPVNTHTSTTPSTKPSVKTLEASPVQQTPSQRQK